MHSEPKQTTPEKPFLLSSTRSSVFSSTTEKTKDCPPRRTGSAFPISYFGPWKGAHQPRLCVHSHRHQTGKHELSIEPKQLRRADC
ncbi:hypothetical protein SLA2020_339370 [Shorea laevis]